MIILGAPRSGTNMLRDLLDALPSLGTWPCDEINYIWRHGNVRFPTDEIPANSATPAVRNYIRRKFVQIQDKLDVDVVVEKTCANCLRVPFIEAVLEKPRYIHIIRNGIDAAGSARLRWSGRSGFKYLADKARWVPITDLPYYASNFVANKAYQMLSNEHRLAFWGPKLPGMRSIIKSRQIEEVCALQWQYCVESVERSFKDVPKGRIKRVHYESFVVDPVSELSEILEFLHVDFDPESIHALTAGVSANSVGKGIASFSAAQRTTLETLLGSTLSELGYG
ncbi:sulfotransferase [Myxococcota bacterium]|nr:sulfotransferase [Myxococcota bacterium]